MCTCECTRVYTTTSTRLYTYRQSCEHMHTRSAHENTQTHVNIANIHARSAAKHKPTYTLLTTVHASAIPQAQNPPVPLDAQISEACSTCTLAVKQSRHMTLPAFTLHFMHEYTSSPALNTLPHPLT